MKPLLEKLWDFYLSEHSIENDPEKSRLVGAIADTLEQLLCDMNDDQRKLFQIFSDLQSEYQARSECDAFIGGVRFASDFLAEIRYGQKS